MIAAQHLPGLKDLLKMTFKKREFTENTLMSIGEGPAVFEERFRV
ncbi:hypothetical protein PO124_17715 [Bacillus licheniformis]|nr:hypothetical protein [Bacillus licheniformis]